MSKEQNPLILSERLDEEVRVSSRRRAIAFVAGATGAAIVIAAGWKAYEYFSSQPTNCHETSLGEVCRLPPIESK